MRFESTEGGAVVDTFEGDEGGEDENKGKEKSEDEDGVEEGSIGNVASCDLDLHQVNKAIVVVAVAAARYGDASHARREVKLHRRSRRSPTAATTLPPRQNDNDTHHAHTFTLDLPAVHFMCMHSFHLRCLGDNEKECPQCAPEYRSVLEMKKNLEQNSKDQDRFFQQVKSSKDGFSVIAEYFGKGIISKISNGSTSGPVSGTASSSSGF